MTTATSTAWRNRIVGHGDETPGELLANPRNWRIHPKHQQDALAGVLNEIGWVQEITVNKRTGFVVDGHLRVALAVSRHERFVPVRYVDLDEDEEALILATLDPISALAGSDADQLTALLAGLEPADAAVANLLRDLAPPRQKQLNPDDADLTPPAEPITQPGDLWLLGDHRLLCGDATNAQDVEWLLAGAKPNLMVTDPPYGMEYDAAWRDTYADAGLISHAASRVAGFTDDRRDWGDAWRLSPSSVIYCWHSPAYEGTQAQLAAARFETRSLIIWAKQAFAISRGHYHGQFEPCWYAVREGSNASWIGDRSQSTLWEITWDSNVPGGHSTQKPLECMARPIRNHEGDVYDPFLGSGTTLIAAEQLGRRCYAIEISPAYCDVSVRRWERVSGRQAVKTHP